ncbi:MAG TPA: hypothetical protein PKL62_04620 [Accumulibacter sp.]|uniref:hypothetical protein n=1 Tax=Accumulibacter sp. TaxID=2053492 RepID=UPI002C0360F0|nr:hypothetical protein [Accumulibacter sp.]HNN83423.1 hypothetical protein [Accumulibacter sp.]
MKDAVKKFYEFLDRPLFPSARLLLVVLLVPLFVSLVVPLWQIRMEAPQYPRGLHMDIYSYTIEGGNDGHDIVEINTLNHYIGMHKIDRQSLSDLDFMPFLFGVLALLVLRVAAIGNVRALIDLTVLAGYGCTFAFGRFIYRLYVFGHELDPTAPVKVKPFTPVIIGSKQIANFTTHSYPQLGAILVGVFLLGLVLILAWHLIAGRRAAAAAG